MSNRDQSMTDLEVSIDDRLNALIADAKHEHPTLGMVLCIVGAAFFGEKIEELHSEMLPWFFSYQTAFMKEITDKN